MMGHNTRSGNILSFLLPLFQEGQLSVTGEKYMHEVLVNRLGGLSLPRKSVVRLTDRPDMTLDVYRGRKTTTQCNMMGHNERICRMEPINEILKRSPPWMGLEPGIPRSAGQLLTC